VGQDALSHLFRILKDKVRLVVLNACSSRPQAEAISKTVDCTIGMNRPIGDAAAIVFASSFYRGLGFGRSVKESFELCRAALLLEGISEDLTPELMVRDGVDAATLFLVSSIAQPTSGAPAKQFNIKARITLVKGLSELTPSDWLTIVAMLPGAASKLGHYGSIGFKSGL
jgi:hypothetical protein